MLFRPSAAMSLPSGDCGAGRTRFVDVDRMWPLCRWRRATHRREARTHARHRQIEASIAIEPPERLHPSVPTVSWCCSFVQSLA